MSWEANHDNMCYCGEAKSNPHSVGHIVGQNGCRRHFVEPPVCVDADKDMWNVEGQVITGYNMRHTRYYYKHKCGCWSAV